MKQLPDITPGGLTLPALFGDEKPPKWGQRLLLFLNAQARAVQKAIQGNLGRDNLAWDYKEALFSHGVPLKLSTTKVKTPRGVILLDPDGAVVVAREVHGTAIAGQLSVTLYFGDSTLKNVRVGLFILPDGAASGKSGTYSPSSSPGGAAGGDLGGSYPNPTVLSIADVITGVLAVTNGGTGLSGFTAGDLIYASALNTLARLGIDADGKVLTLSGGRPNWISPSSSAASLYGDGSDGNVTITTTVTISRPMFYNNLTISGSGKLVTNHWPVFVKGTLDLTAAGAGAIVGQSTSLNGVSSTTGTQGAGAAALSNSVWFSNSSSGTNGTNGGSGAASTGSSSSIGVAVSAGGVGGAGGTGGAGSSFGGGTPSAPGAINFALPWRVQMNGMPLPIAPQSSITGGEWCGGTGGTGGTGGGGGAGGTTGQGGGGGGGGAGGNMQAIWAKNLSVTGCAAGALDSSGGSGGGGGPGGLGNSVGVGGGAGGGGGGGGEFYLQYHTLTGTATNAIFADGGAGGTGGAGAGTGAVGNGGKSGFGGCITVVCTSTGTLTVTDNTATQHAASGATGGTAVQTRFSF